MIDRHDFSFLITHFGNEKWLNYTIRNICRFFSSESKIFIINQNRVPLASQNYKNVVEILQFPRQTTFPSLDHALSLDQTLRLTNFQSKYLVILDNDAFPVSNHWFQMIIDLLEHSDAILAQDPRNPNLSHPCFAVIPTRLLAELNFSEGVGSHKREMQFDTGRLIYSQLKGKCRVKLAPPEVAFPGLFGDTYLERSLIHVGSISLRQLDSEKLRFTNRVLNYFSIESRLFLALNYRFFFGKRLFWIPILGILVLVHFSIYNVTLLIKNLLGVKLSAFLK